MRSWVRTHAPHCLGLLTVIACLLRVVLVIDSPRPWGYVWDRYHPGIQILYATGELAESQACWQCYHPPVFYYAGLPFYWLGAQIAGAAAVARNPALPVRLVVVLSLVCTAIAVLYCDKLLRLYRLTGEYRVLGVALALSLPCLYLASGGVEADIVLTAILCAFLYYVTRYFCVDSGSGFQSILVLGVLAGLAAGTKYNGLLAVAVGGVLIASKHLPQRRFRRMLRDASALGAIALAIGGWKYADNYQKYGTPLFANGTALEGFSLERQMRWGEYQFARFPLVGAISLMSPGSPEGLLTDLPPYRSVWSTLHTLFWSDMSLFSRANRHGGPPGMYPTKQIPVWLPASVVVLALLPTLLAIVGLGVTLTRRSLWPLLVMSGVTWLVYVQWFVAQTDWALKAKYILFLLPAYLVYMCFGLKWVEGRAPAPAKGAVWGSLVLLVALTHVYLLRFAIG